ncbi:MAG: peptide chain release factor 1 [Erysipelotrichaceae bacterium]|jgi:peptide chain release factor 1|nr:peptide chain release factor 1 [Erysipelotrichaceae bacterium]
MDESMRKRLEATKKRCLQIDADLAKDENATDPEKLMKLSKERSDLQEAFDRYLEYERLESDVKDSYEMENGDDEELAEFAKATRKEAETRMEELEKEFKTILLPKDPNDDKNIIVEIRGAVGGDEANLFAGDLLRMYTKYAERQGWKLQLLDASLGAAGGYSSVSFMIKGDSVYSKLKFESGAHRVQRVPKTEASGRIHTSTATVLVMPEAKEVDVTINPNDLKIDTYHSQGAGGQNVNKTESAVRITHIPTGLVAACQTEKAQLQNKEIAMQMIRAKVFAFFQEQEDAKRATERKLKVGTGERSEKIRTYNFPQNRVTDHRVGFTINQLDRVMEGELDAIIAALIHFDQEQKLLEQEGEANA